jgi:multidrug efflux pump subunit AcrA (membrane-fusion protein)
LTDGAGDGQPGSMSALSRYAALWPASATRRSRSGVSTKLSDKAKAWSASVAALAVVGGFVIVSPRAQSAAASPPPSVDVSAPLQREVGGRLEFLAQFSAARSVELRAQVGGILTQIGFKDGDIAQKGDLLFEIDPTPYNIRLSQATAQLQTARAKLELATLQSSPQGPLVHSFQATRPNRTVGLVLRRIR